MAHIGVWGACIVAAMAMAMPARAQAPRFSDGGFDAAAYGADKAYPLAVVHHPRFWVAAFSQHDGLWESRRVPRADVPAPLKRASAEPDIRYRLGLNPQPQGIDDYLSRHPATGLLIAQGRADGDRILVERYQYARRDHHRFASFSMAKTVTALLLGIAMAEGHIRALDDRADQYAATLRGTPYGSTTLRHLLQMSSGVRFSEHYRGGDDVERLWLGTVGQAGPGGAAALQAFTDRHRAPGAVFAYSSAETQVLGLVLAAATGRPMADYLADTIWRPMGAEADASWLVDAAGQEAAYCCLNAVLRDWARLALLLAHEGRRGERQIIPVAWVHEATRLAPDRPDLALVWDDAGFGYGYQTWLLPGPRRQFALVGLHGQVILVDPPTRLVLVHTAVRRLGGGSADWRELLALWNAAVAAATPVPAPASPSSPPGPLPR